MKRSRLDRLTADEVRKVEEGYLRGRRPSDIAAELKCSARSINARFEKMRGEAADRRRKSPTHVIKDNSKPKQTEAERRAKRFYHSTFEL